MRAVNSLAMEARGIRLQGELGISRNTTAQGMPGCFGCTCMFVCAFLSASCTRDRGCQPAPGIPCTLSFEGRTSSKVSGASCRENAKVYSAVIVHEGGRSSIPEMPVMESIGHGVLDTRLRGYDNLSCRDSVASLAMTVAGSHTQ